MFKHDRKSNRLTGNNRIKNVNTGIFSVFIFFFMFLSKVGFCYELSAFSESQIVKGYIVDYTTGGYRAPMIYCISTNTSVYLRVPELNAEVQCNGRDKIESEIGVDYKAWNYELLNKSITDASVIVVSGTQEEKSVPARNRCTIQYNSSIDLGELQQGTLPPAVSFAGSGSGAGTVTITSHFRDAGGLAYIRDYKSGNRIFIKVLKNGSDMVWEPSLLGWKGEITADYALKVDSASFDPGNYTGYLYMKMDCL